MPVIILDRDGVINADRPDFVKCADEWHPLPGSIDAIARLSQAGYRIAVASNQSGLGRGLFDETALEEIHEKMLVTIREAGGVVELIEICPHHPDERCQCRKPEPGLLHSLAAQMDVDLHGVPCVGDSTRDIQAAAVAGARPMLVMTGNGRETLREMEDIDMQQPETFDDLSAVADFLIEEYRP